MSAALAAPVRSPAAPHELFLARWYRGTGCPTLIQHCHRISKRLSKDRPATEELPFLAGLSVMAETGNTNLTGMSTTETPEWLLNKLVRAATAREGALFLPQKDPNRTLIKTRRDALPEGLERWAYAQMESTLNTVTETQAGEGGLVDSNLISFEDNKWRLYVPICDDGAEQQLVGAVALCEPSLDIPLRALPALARMLMGGHAALPQAR